MLCLDVHNRSQEECLVSPVAISRASCIYSLSNSIHLFNFSPLGLSWDSQETGRLLLCSRVLQENPLLSVSFQSQPIPSGLFPFVSFSQQRPTTHNQLHSCSRNFLLASEVTEYSLVCHGGTQESPGSLFLSSATLFSDHTLQTSYSLTRANSQISLVSPFSPESGCRDGK